MHDDVGESIAVREVVEVELDELGDAHATIFETRWQHNQEQGRAEAAAVAGRWDQADALLLLESGWSQERIARKVGKSRQWVEKYLRFGTFLNCYRGSNRRHDASGASIPSSLTERLFRAAWAKTLKRSPDGKKHTSGAGRGRRRRSRPGRSRPGPGR